MVYKMFEEQIERVNDELIKGIKPILENIAISPITKDTNKILQSTISNMMDSHYEVRDFYVNVSGFQSVNIDVGFLLHIEPEAESFCDYHKLQENLIDYNEMRNEFIETINEKPIEDSKVICVTRWGGESFQGTFKKGNFICEKTDKVYEGSMDIVRWKYNGS
jgi:hypothetical protein